MIIEPIQVAHPFIMQDKIKQRLKMIKAMDSAFEVNHIEEKIFEVYGY